MVSPTYKLESRTQIWIDKASLTVLYYKIMIRKRRWSDVATHSDIPFTKFCELVYLFVPNVCSFYV